MVKLGNVVSTPGALESLTPMVMIKCITRHQRGDWGDVNAEDSAANDDALLHDGRLLSSYHEEGIKIWIITEWDRSVTTVMLPEEY